MKLFGKKKLSLDEILAGIEALSDEDKERLRLELGGADEESTEESAEAPTEEPSGTEQAEETPAGEEPPENPEEEAPAEQTEPAASEQSEEDPHTEGEESMPPPEELSEERAEKEGDGLAALRAEMAELSKTVEALAARIGADAENNGGTDKGEAFGLAADTNGHEAPEEDDLDRAIRKHWNF